MSFNCIDCKIQFELYFNFINYTISMQNIGALRVLHANQSVNFE